MKITYKYGLFTLSEKGEVLETTFFAASPNLETDVYGDAVPICVGSNQTIKLIETKK